jgi:hypothetical protein
MAINISKIKQPFKGVSSSWSDFYLNMALEMAENVAKSKAGAISANKGLLDFTGDAEGVKNLNDNFWFAQSITEEYDKVVRGGQTIVGGRAVSIGNTAAMQASLLGILSTTQTSKTGDLLRDIGPAVQAYWIGAQLERFPPPNIPCIGSVQNISTILGVNFSPGIWTPISIPPMGSVSPWLLNFILSASVHLLTVGGLFTCTCQYPPPAPPAPGVLPWAGYFIKPFSGNPISSLDFKDMVSLAGGTLLTPVLDAVAGDTLDLSASNLSANLFKGFVEGGEFQEPQIQAALNSIISGDEPAMASAGNNITNNRV